MRKDNSFKPSEVFMKAYDKTLKKRRILYIMKVIFVVNRLIRLSFHWSVKIVRSSVPPIIAMIQILKMELAINVLSNNGRIGFIM